MQITVKYYMNIGYVIVCLSPKLSNITPEPRFTNMV